MVAGAWRAGLGNRRLELGRSVFFHAPTIPGIGRSGDHLGGPQGGLDVGYCQIEKLANLEQLPATGFLVSCFPFKIKGASAGFTRAVAIL